MSKRVVSVVSAIVAVVMSVPAFAQETGRNGQCSGASGNASVNQTFCFEPEPVRGGLVGATGQTVRPLRRVQSESLLRIRAHFVTEMMKSVENL
ncbi:MAG: hypothetical protein JNK05_36705 [Myxococcales bacterium]|nr:hypothetical protein [Myxococcales bacterium]